MIAAATCCRFIQRQCRDARQRDPDGACWSSFTPVCRRFVGSSLHVPVLARSLNVLGDRRRRFSAVPISQKAQLFDMAPVAARFELMAFATVHSAFIGVTRSARSRVHDRRRLRRSVFLAAGAGALPATVGQRIAVQAIRWRCMVAQPGARYGTSIDLPIRRSPPCAPRRRRTASGNRLHRRRQLAARCGGERLQLQRADPGSAVRRLPVRSRSPARTAALQLLGKSSAAARRGSAVVTSRPPGESVGSLARDGAADAVEDDRRQEGRAVARTSVAQPATRRSIMIWKRRAARLRDSPRCSRRPRRRARQFWARLHEQRPGFRLLWPSRASTSSRPQAPPSLRDRAAVRSQGARSSTAWPAPTPSAADGARRPMGDRALGVAVARAVHGRGGR